MSKQTPSPFHTADVEWLTAYTAGALSPLKRLLIDCQTALQPAVNAQLEALYCVGGTFLESAKGEPLSSDFSRRLFAALDAAPSEQEQSGPASAPGWMPNALQEFINEAGLAINWRKSGPGVERASLLDENGERLYLLRARPGLKLPVHSHKGQEWTLILQGGYHVREIGYGRGDLHCEDEFCQHQPVIDDDEEACISLVVDEGKLVFKDPIMKIIQPFIGI